VRSCENTRDEVTIFPAGYTVVHCDICQYIDPSLRVLARYGGSPEGNVTLQSASKKSASMTWCDAAEEKIV
jgi:hypothetical protein